MVFVFFQLWLFLYLRTVFARDAFAWCWRHNQHFQSHVDRAVRFLMGETKIIFWTPWLRQHLLSSQNDEFNCMLTDLRDDHNYPTRRDSVYHLYNFWSCSEVWFVIFFSLHSFSLIPFQFEGVQSVPRICLNGCKMPKHKNGDTWGKPTRVCL